MEINQYWFTGYYGNDTRSRREGVKVQITSGLKSFVQRLQDNCNLSRAVFYDVQWKLEVNARFCGVKIVTAVKFSFYVTGHRKAQ